MPTRRRPSRPCQAHAFTLVELVASMAVLGVLMMAIGSTVLLASKAIPDPDQPAMRSIAAARAIEKIAADLEATTHVSQADHGILEFYVADRNSDGNSERQRYRWSGVPGDPLTLEYNGGSAQTVIANVTSFNVETVTQTITFGEPPLIEDSEQIVFSLDQWSSSYGGKLTISSGVRVAEAFRPSLGSAVSWRPTRAAIRMEPVNPTSAVLRIALRAATGNGRPGDLVLGSTDINEGDLSGDSWTIAPLHSSFDLDANQRYFIGVEHVSGTTAGYLWRGYYGSDGHYVDPGDGEFDAQSFRTMWVYLWGKPLIPDPDWEPETETVIKRVTLTLKVGEGDHPPARTTLTLLNQPKQ